MNLHACSVASLEAGESLAATAVESVDRWLLLEVAEPWAPKALQTEALPAAVRTKLADWQSAPRTRLQLIRRPGRSGKRPLIMQVRSEADRHQASKLELDRYEDLLELDFDALPAVPATPICLVCVHGHRDRCCALHGSAVFRAIQSQGVETWQSSHLGGHRFAACVLWLPDGLMYGRLRAEHVPAFVQARQAGELGNMDFFRGHCAYDRPTQAAEIFLRRKLGEQDTSAVTLISSESEDESTSLARFRTASGETSVRVRLEPTGIEAPASCGGEPEPVTRFVEL